MSIHRVGLLLGIAIVALHPGALSAQQEVKQPEVVTSASASRPVKADLATLTLRFWRVGATPAEAGRNVALATDSVRRALAELGIPRDSIASGSRWSWWRERVQLITEMRHDQQTRTSHQDTTYRVHEALHLRVRDVGKVGAVIDLALAHRITDISDVRFSATNTEQAEREALREATEKARARAADMAAAGGGRLGKTISLTTERTSYRSADLFSLSSMSDGNTDPTQTVVVAPVVHVHASVSGRWEFTESP